MPKLHFDHSKLVYFINWCIYELLLVRYGNSIVLNCVIGLIIIIIIIITQSNLILFLNIIISFDCYIKLFSKQLSGKVLIHKFDKEVCLQTKVVLKNLICHLAFIKDPCIDFW